MHQNPHDFGHVTVLPVDFTTETKQGADDFTVTVVVKNGLKRRVTATLESVQVNLFDPIDDKTLPAIVVVEPGKESRVSFKFRKSIAGTEPKINFKFQWKDSNQAGGGGERSDMPSPTPMWDPIPGTPPSTPLSFRHSHKTRTLEVEITSYKVRGSEQLNRPVRVQAKPGATTAIPGVKRIRPAIIKYRFRLLPNTRWQEGTPTSLG